MQHSIVTTHKAVHMKSISLISGGRGEHTNSVWKEQMNFRILGNNCTVFECHIL